MGDTHNGCVVKRARFLGRAAHAGAHPHLGVNALKAATLALGAIEHQRETFRDEDGIRVHPIITRGGEAVTPSPPTCAWRCWYAVTPSTPSRTRP